jgi:hypothetical protein
LFLGGQRNPFPGGQHTPFSGGHFNPFLGGQHERFFQYGELIDNENVVRFVDAFVEQLVDLKK